MISESIVKRFVAMTSGIKSKRVVEWGLMLTCNVIWSFIVILLVLMFKMMSGWWILAGVVISVVVVGLLAILQYGIINVMLELLYPQTSSTDVNGDDNEDFITKMNSFMQLLNEANNE